MLKDQRQAFARVHRTGQKRPTKLYLLHSPGNPVERGCIKRQKRQGQLGEITWQVSTRDTKIEHLKAQKRAEREASLMKADDAV